MSQINFKKKFNNLPLWIDNVLAIAIVNCRYQSVGVQYQADFPPQVLEIVVVAAVFQPLVAIQIFHRRRFPRHYFVRVARGGNHVIAIEILRALLTESRVRLSQGRTAVLATSEVRLRLTVDQSSQCLQALQKQIKDNKLIFSFYL